MTTDEQALMRARDDFEDTMASGFGKSAQESACRFLNTHQNIIRSLIKNAIATLPSVPAPPGEEEEIYEIGKRDGYEEAVQDIDILTGGDGEYFASNIPGEGCPDPDAMKARIAERFKQSSVPASGQRVDVPTWIIWYEDTNQAPEFFTDKKAAFNAFAQARASWTCHLFSNVTPAPEAEKCPLGDNCDLTIAYMKGVKDGRDGQKNSTETGKSVDVEALMRDYAIKTYGHDEEKWSLPLADRAVFDFIASRGYLAAAPVVPERITKYQPGHWFVTKSIDEMQMFYLSRLPAIREAARELGYAIGLHGSTRRDFDLMAMPWREDAAPINDLAAAVSKAACGFHHAEYEWTQKPAGRLAVSLPCCWVEIYETDLKSLGHIDLSVVLSAAPPPPARERGE